MFSKQTTHPKSLKARQKLIGKLQARQNYLINKIIQRYTLVLQLIPGLIHLINNNLKLFSTSSEPQRLTFNDSIPTILFKSLQVFLNAPNKDDLDVRRFLLGGSKFVLDIAATHYYKKTLSDTLQQNYDPKVGSNYMIQFIHAATNNLALKIDRTSIDDKIIKNPFEADQIIKSFEESNATLEILAQKSTQKRWILFFIVFSLLVTNNLALLNDDIGLLLTCSYIYTDLTHQLFFSNETQEIQTLKSEIIAEDLAELPTKVKKLKLKKERDSVRATNQLSETATESKSQNETASVKKPTLTLECKTPDPIFVTNEIKPTQAPKAIIALPKKNHLEEHYDNLYIQLSKKIKKLGSQDSKQQTKFQRELDNIHKNTTKINSNAVMSLYDLQNSLPVISNKTKSTDLNKKTNEVKTTLKQVKKSVKTSTIKKEVKTETKAEIKSEERKPASLQSTAFIQSLTCALKKETKPATTIVTKGLHVKPSDWFFEIEHFKNLIIMQAENRREFTTFERYALLYYLTRFYTFHLGGQYRNEFFHALPRIEISNEFIAASCQLIIDAKSEPLAEITQFHEKMENTDIPNVKEKMEQWLTTLCILNPNNLSEGETNAARILISLYGEAARSIKAEPKQGTFLFESIRLRNKETHPNYAASKSEISQLITCAQAYNFYLADEEEELKPEKKSGLRI